jgi:ketosteroid isomerase-like protein
VRWTAVVLLSFALAGCGDAAPAPPAATPARSADERAIRQTLERYVAAVRANDPRAVCRLTAREVLATIDAIGTDCETMIADQVAEGGPRFALTTESIQVSGDYAMTRGRAVESDGPRSGDQPLVRERGRWLLTTKAR